MCTITNYHHTITNTNKKHKNTKALSYTLTHTSKHANYQNINRHIGLISNCCQHKFRPIVRSDVQWSHFAVIFDHKSFLRFFRSTPT